MSKVKLTRLDETDWKILEEFAKNDMCVQRTANANYLANSSVYYRLRKIQHFTGLNPLRFYDLVELLQMKDGYLE